MYGACCFNFVALIAAAVEICVEPSAWGRPRLPPSFVSLSLHCFGLIGTVGGSEVDVMRIPFPFRSIEFCSCERSFGVGGAGASHDSSVFRPNIVASFGSDWRCRRRRCRCKACFVSI